MPQLALGLWNAVAQNTLQLKVSGQSSSWRRTVFMRSNRVRSGGLPPLLQAEFGPTAVVIAHPDDETIGVGAHLPLLHEPIILLVTSGAPIKSGDHKAAGCNHPEYGAVRLRELRAAMAVAGLSKGQLEAFSFTDQRVSFGMAPLARRLARWLHLRGIELLLTHAYEMGHPDHDAIAFSVHAAVALMQRCGLKPPRVLEFTSYHRGANGIEVGCFPPDTDLSEVIPLTPAQQALKARMFACYASQSKTLEPFDCTAERFRIAPAYRFTERPHGRGAYYDDHDWGMRSERWLGLAAEALGRLGLRPS
jgi:LmbE family N-acetylglucosaminyl deacetylase